MKLGIFLLYLYFNVNVLNIRCLNKWGWYICMCWYYDENKYVFCLIKYFFVSNVSG